MSLLSFEKNKKAIKMQPNTILAKQKFKLGIKAHVTQQYEKAIAFYDEAISVNPNYALAYSNKGISLDELGRKADAIKCYDRAITINPRFVDAYVNKGTVLNEMGNNIDSIKCYDQSIKINPKYTGAYYNKGNALKCQEKYEEVIENQNKVIELEPKHDLAHFAKAIAQHCLGRQMESIIWFDKTICLDPTNAQPYSEKGCVLKTLQRYSDAAELHDKAIELDEDYSQAYYYKGDCMKSLQKYTEAIELFDKAIKLEPKEVLFFVNKGNCLNLIEDGNWGRSKEAIDCFEKANDLLNKGNEINYIGMEAFKDLDQDRQKLTKEIIKVSLVPIEVGISEDAMDIKVLRDELVSSFLNTINDKSQQSKVEQIDMMKDLKNLYDMIQKSLGDALLNQNLNKSKTEVINQNPPEEKTPEQPMSLLQKIKLQKRATKQDDERQNNENTKLTAEINKTHSSQSIKTQEMDQEIPKEDPKINDTKVVNIPINESKESFQEQKWPLNVTSPLGELKSPDIEIICNENLSRHSYLISNRDSFHEAVFTKNNEESMDNTSKDIIEQSEPSIKQEQYNENKMYMKSEEDEFNTAREIKAKETLDTPTQKSISILQSKPGSNKRVIMTMKKTIKMKGVDRHDLMNIHLKDNSFENNDEFDKNVMNLDDDIINSSLRNTNPAVKKSKKAQNAKIFIQDSEIFDFGDDVINLEEENGSFLNMNHQSMSNKDITTALKRNSSCSIVKQDETSQKIIQDMHSKNCIEEKQREEDELDSNRQDPTNKKPTIELSKSQLTNNKIEINDYESEEKHNEIIGHSQNSYKTIDKKEEMVNSGLHDESKKKVLWTKKLDPLKDQKLVSPISNSNKLTKTNKQIEYNELDSDNTSYTKGFFKKNEQNQDYQRSGLKIEGKPFDGKSVMLHKECSKKELDNGNFKENMANIVQSDIISDVKTKQKKKAGCFSWLCGSSNSNNNQAKA